MLKPDIILLSLHPVYEIEISVFDDFFVSLSFLSKLTSPPAVNATASYEPFNSIAISDFFYPSEAFFFMKISSLHPLVTPEM